MALTKAGLFQIVMLLEGKLASRQGWLRSLLFVAMLLAAWSPASGQDRTLVPVTIDGERLRLSVITYKPPGAGPFPTLIFHHGSTGGGTDPSLFSLTFEPEPFLEWLAARGWAVVLPNRRGRGGSEGLYDEGFADDRTQGYSCDASRLLWGAERALKDVEAVTPRILSFPFVDNTRVAVGGHSRGGVLAIAWAARHSDQARAVVNFNGGWRSTSYPSATAVNQQLLTRNAALVPPSLWLYGTHDPYYPITHSRANFAAASGVCWRPLSSPDASSSVASLGPVLSSDGQDDQTESDKARRVDERLAVRSACQSTGSAGRALSPFSS